MQMSQSMLITLSVDLGPRSYPILIGSGLLSQPMILEPYLKHRDVLVVRRCRTNISHYRRTASIHRGFPPTQTPAAVRWYALAGDTTEPPA